MRSQTRKNGKIELMRFVFCLCVLFYHCNTQMGEKRFVYPSVDSLTFFFRGYIGVEFFFAVSGFLMAKSAFKKIKSGKALNAGAEAWAYVKKKYLKIFPVHLTAFIALFALRAVMWYYVNHPVSHRVAAVVALTAVMTAVCELGGKLFEKLALTVRNKALNPA